MIPLCKECGNESNPEYTMIAAENGCPGEPDLHFCRECFNRSMGFWNLISDAIKSGKVTREQVEEEIRKEEYDG